MTSAQFRALGEALRGPSWQTQIAADIGRDDRTVRHYAAGTRPIPPAIARAMIALCYTHCERLRALARTIKLPK
jgi:hypothetical protein